MNNTRRKEIEKLRNQLFDIKAMLDAARDNIEALKDEEQEYRDNMPESIGEGDKGQAAEAAVDAFDEAISTIEEIMETIETADSQLETAAA